LISKNNRDQFERRPAASPGYSWATPCICITLAVLVILVFGQVARHDFVNYDDDLYVYANPQVLQGLTMKSFVWAFTSGHATNWHPVTWLSHMADIELFGLVGDHHGGFLDGPGGHHLMSVMLHLLNTVLLFLVLKAMTDAVWPAAGVAALFAVHPTHVESVAWIAERKDVLSGLFWMLTMLAYIAYSRRSTPGRYLLVLALYAAGLMAKPMLVTLPFVLLLLDYWPLRRSSRARSWRRLWSEKVPLFALSAVSCVVTYQVQLSGGAVRSLDVVPLHVRAINAPVAYMHYLLNMVWPQGLAVHYPLESTATSPEWAVLALLVFIAITLVAWRCRSTLPCLVVGWLWFVGTLVPVIGIVQVGDQAYADKYTYLPYIGLLIAVAYGLRGVPWTWPARDVLFRIAAALVVGAFSWCAWVQTGFWKNSETLFTHALAVTENNARAYYNRGVSYLESGKHDSALNDFDKAIELKKDHVEAYSNRAMLYQMLRRYQDAAADFESALRLKANPLTYYNRGRLFSAWGKFDRALDDYTKAIELQPDFSKAYHNRGHTYFRMDKNERALADLDRAIHLDPYDATAYNNRGGVYQNLGQNELALADYTKAIKLEPDHVSAYYNRGRAFAQAGTFDRAVSDFTEAIALQPDFTNAYLHRGNAFEVLKKYNLASADYTRSIQVQPRNAQAQSNLARLLATCPDAKYRNGPKAVSYATRACELLQWKDSRALWTLAAAYAESGQFGEAAKFQTVAIEHAPAEMKAELLQQLELYQRGQPPR